MGVRTTCGHTPANLGINTETLSSWIRAADGVGSGAHSAPHAAELAAARKRICELEGDILRKAARYFAGETRW